MKRFCDRSLAVLILICGLMAMVPMTAMGAAAMSFHLIDSRGTVITTTSMTGVPTSISMQNRQEPVCRISSGTGAGSVDLAPFVSSRTLGLGASEDIDVRSYADQIGNSVTTMTKLKYLRIENTGTVSITFGNAAATQLIGLGFLRGGTDTLTLLAGQDIEFCLSAGMTVSAGAKDLKILNESGATGATYDMIIAGSSS